MKNCKNCGWENSDDALYCGKCGSKLAPDSIACPACGAENSADMNFCGKCGAKLVPEQKPAVCGRCGAKLDKDAAFCTECGAPVNGEAHYSQGSAPAPAKAKGASGAIGKVKAFENKHHYIINGLIAALALVFALVAFLAPIKVAMPAGMNIGEADESEIELSATEISQSPWQILGAIGYIDISGDVKKVEDFIPMYRKIEKQYNIYLAENKFDSESEKLQKLQEITAEVLEDNNALGYILATTSVGAYDHFMTIIVEGKVQAEQSLGKMLDYEHGVALDSLITALVALALQFAAGILSLVFLGFAIYGMVKRKGYDLYKLLIPVTIISGIALCVQALGAGLVPGGAVFAIALTAMLAMLCCGTAGSLIAGNGVALTVKRAVYAAVMLVCFFVMTGHFLSVNAVIGAGGEDAGNIKISAPVGSALDTFIMSLTFTGMGTGDSKISFEYSTLSQASAVLTLVLGFIAFCLLFAGALLALLSLVSEKRNHTADIAVAFFAIMALLLFAILPAIFGAVDSAPEIPTGSKNVVGTVVFEFSARAHVYVSLVFAVVAAVFWLIFRPEKARKNA